MQARIFSCFSSPCTAPKHLEVATFDIGIDGESYNRDRSSTGKIESVYVLISERQDGLGRGLSGLQATVHYFISFLN